VPGRIQAQTIDDDRVFGLRTKAFQEGCSDGARICLCRGTIDRRSDLVGFETLGAGDMSILEFLTHESGVENAHVGIVQP